MRKHPRDLVHDVCSPRFHVHHSKLLSHVQIHRFGTLLLPRLLGVARASGVKNLTLSRPRQQQQYLELVFRLRRFSSSVLALLRFLVFQNTLCTHGGSLNRPDPNCLYQLLLSSTVSATQRCDHIYPLFYISCIEE